MVQDFKLLYPKRCGRQVVLNVAKNYSFVYNLKQGDGEITTCVITSTTTLSQTFKLRTPSVIKLEQARTQFLVLISNERRK